MADALGLLRETNLKQSHPHITLPVLPDKSNSYVMEDENLEVSAVTNIQALDEQQEESLKEGILNSSPVANPNAMNKRHSGSCGMFLGTFHVVVSATEMEI
ncbi:hypothetical protein C4D60_Mb01t27250 [Musa balbisiana]|uniref:Uncharacterized protein n=1 Tax=Musa balbisiana TaxID=52838 RepID=A0A4S8JR31_MUSBA|nr:hypothetical protein C4D60_Mb01t27250 [Musa balbisiana]